MSLDRMTCEECEAVADDHAEGWRVYVIGDELEIIDHPIAGEARVLFYCPSCAEREFSPPG